MSNRTAFRLAWSVWGLTLALSAVAGAFAAVNGDLHGAAIADFAMAWIAIQAFPTVGAVIASRQPSNPIGWLFCSASILMMTANVVSGYVDYAVAHALPGTVAVVVVLDWTWVAGVGLLVPAALLFPDGHLPSPRWRAVGWFAVCWLATLSLAFLLEPGPLESPLEEVDNPLGVPGMQVVEAVVGAGGGIALVLTLVWSLVYRYRKGSSERREQLKWFFAAVVGTITFVIVAGVFNVGVPDAVWLAFIATIPASVGVAILRYRLYEIDRIVNRTVVYLAVTALLAGLYFGIVIALQEVFGGLTRGNDLAIAGSTLAVAALFRPARRRIQGFVDRRFYRRRYDAQRTLEAFSVRLRDEVDLDQLGVDLGAVVHETMQPAHVSLWLRPPIDAVTAAVTISGRPPGTKEVR